MRQPDSERFRMVQNLVAAPQRQHPREVTESVTDAEIADAIAKLVKMSGRQGISAPISGYGDRISTFADLIADVESRGYQGVRVILHNRSVAAEADESLEVAEESEPEIDAITAETIEYLQTALSGNGVIKVHGMFRTPKRLVTELRMNPGSTLSRGAIEKIQSIKAYNDAKIAKVERDAELAKRFPHMPTVARPIAGKVVDFIREVFN